jgi:S-adenosylmethionine:tRNA ribosyltransferase-isomerase
MSALELELPAALEATEPPEARGLARDEVRLMVTRCADPSLEHSRFRDLPAHLRAGDLLIVNNSMTLPAAVPGERGDGESVEVRFSTLAPEGAGSGTASVPDSGEDQPQGPRLIVELRSADGTLPLGDGHAAQWIALAGGAGLQLLEPFNGSGRLWVAELAGVGDLHYYLGRFGHPIR